MPRPKKATTDEEYWENRKKIEEDVIDSINKGVDLYPKLKKFPVTIISNPLDPDDREWKYIKTNTTLDEILSYKGKGVREWSTLEIYGEYASGKSEILKTMASESKGLIIFIDTESTFNPEQFRDICIARGKDPEDINKRMLLIKPDTWMEQEAVIYHLPEYNKEIGITENPDDFIDIDMVLIDSFMKNYADANEFQGRENLTKRQQYARAWLHKIIRYVRRHHGILAYTNQIYDTPDATKWMSAEDKIKPRGGRSLEHIGDYIIWIRKASSRTNVRIARLMDAPDLPLQEVPFMITEKGIVDIEKPEERAKALVEVAKYEERFLSGQFGSQPAGDKWKEEARKMGIGEEIIEKVEGEVNKEIEDVHGKIDTTDEDETAL